MEAFFPQRIHPFDNEDKAIFPVLFLFPFFSLPLFLSPFLRSPSPLSPPMLDQPLWWPKGKKSSFRFLFRVFQASKVRQKDVE